MPAANISPDRAAGIHAAGPRDPVLYFLQRLRDEAHRFAIGTHRARRTKSITKSPLDDIPGIGGKRKKALLLHFGSAQAVAAAGLTDLETVDGISTAVAKKIYGYFNEDRRLTLSPSAAGDRPDDRMNDRC